MTRVTDKTQEQYERELAAWTVQHQGYIARRDATMLEAGVKVGDRVEYVSVSPWGIGAEVFEGTLFFDKLDRPKVRVGHRVFRWNKGWQKVTA